MKLSDLVSNDPPRVLAYGPTGAGKSTLAGLIALEPRWCPVYVADWDLRIASLRRKLPASVWQNIEVEPYRDVNLQGEAFTKLQAKLERLPAEGFKTFVKNPIQTAFTRFKSSFFSSRIWTSALGFAQRDLYPI